MRSRFLSATAALALGVAVLSAPAVSAQAASAPAATSAVAPITAFTMDGHPQWILDQSVEATTGVSVVSNSPSSVTATAGGASLGFSMPGGAPLAVGSYPTARFADATKGSLDGSARAGANCSQTDGLFTLHELELDGAGQLVRLAGSYSFSCDGAEQVTGEIRLNSTMPYLRFGEYPIGRVPERVVTFTAPGAQTLGAATWAKGAASSFRLFPDGCSGKTLAAGESCSVTIQGWTQQVAPAQDWLTIPINGGGQHRISVDLLGRDTAEGAYHVVTGARLLDTRSRVGITTTTPIPQGGVVDVQVSGRAGVPAGALAAVLNVTAIAPTTAGWLTVYPTGTTKPTASSVNFNRGWTGANLVTVKLGTGGKVRIANAVGKTHVAVDIVGFYDSAAVPATTNNVGYLPVDPTRAYDTRVDGAGKPLASWNYLLAGLNFTSPGVNESIVAYAANITVTKPTRGGWLSTWNGDPNGSPEKTSTLNFTTGRTVPNMAIVPTMPCGSDCSNPNMPVIGVLNVSSGSSHVIVDIVGVYLGGQFDPLRFKPLASPTRVADTRLKLGLPNSLGQGATGTVQMPLTTVGANSWAVVTNLTAAKPTADTWLTLWAYQAARPITSNLNPYAGQLVSNMAITELGQGNAVNVRNQAGTTPFIIDVTGSMEEYPPHTPASWHIGRFGPERSASAVKTLTGTPVHLAPSRLG